MQDTKIEITNGEMFIDLLEKAKENGSFDSLLMKFRRLTSWGTQNPISVNLWTRAYDEINFSLFIKEQRILVGGIIYNRNTKQWGMHT